MKEQDEYITQAEAARLKGCSRQRIEQLVKAGRLRVMEVTTSYGALKNMLYRSEVEALTEAPKGRPRISDEERIKRRTRFGLSEGQKVKYNYRVRDLTMIIDATVLKTGNKKVKIEFTDDAGNILTSWVLPDDLRIIEETSQQAVGIQFHGA